ncbi:hypothetical protein IW136_000591 [Coemansia sp. RSA 678]|nr:hypothetical protein IW136_000591 [Coemansia sp. RSA 678]
MQADTSDTVINKLLDVVGNAPVNSAEDLVVALSQAVLLTLGFEFKDRPATWASPGLPQGRHAAQFVYVSGSDEAVNIDWVAAGSNVMMLVQQTAADDVQSIQLRVASLVAPNVQFPLTTAGTADATLTALATDAVETATAAIRKVLVDTSEAEADASLPPLQSHQTPTAWPQQPSFDDDQPTPFDPPGSIPRGSNPRGVGGTARNPLSVGRDDLDPLGGAMHGGPLGGIDQGGGMLVGPDHPMFRQGGSSGRGTGPLGGPERLPPGAVPPGARFDPISPLGQMPRGGLPRGSGNGGAGPFSGEPDPDNCQPPDASWNYYI